MGRARAVSSLMSVAGRSSSPFVRQTNPLFTQWSRPLRRRSHGGPCDAPSCIRNLRDVPGPRPSLPLIGTNWQYWPLIGSFEKEQLHRVYDEMYKIYGPIHCEEFQWRRPFVKVCKADDFERVLRHQGKYPRRPMNEAVRHYRLSRPERYNSPGLVESDGEEWYSLRSKLTPLLMKPQVVQKYVPCQDEIADDLVECIRRQRHPVSGAIPHLNILLFRYALESVCMFCLDKRIGCLSPNAEEASPDAADLIENVQKLWNSFQEVYFGPPIWKYFPTAAYQRYADAEDRIYTITNRLIDEVEAGLRENSRQGGLISEALLSVADLDRRDVRTTMIDFIAAGIDNTANMIVFVLYLLAKNTACQERLRGELEEVLCGGKERVTAEAIAESPYLKAVLKESFRLMSTTANIVRILPEEVVLSGFRIPAGVPISCQMSVACRLPDYFEEPEAFRPERWLPSASRQPNPFVSLPFGWGSRMCVGRRFAEQEILTTIAKLVMNFEVFYPKTLETVHQFLVVPKKPFGFFLLDHHKP